MVVIYTLLTGPTLPWVAARLRVIRRGEPRDLEVEAAPLERIAADLLQVSITRRSLLHGVEVGELRLPAGASVSLVVRDGQTLVPEQRTVLRHGDDVLVVTPRKLREATEERLRAVSDARAGWPHWLDAPEPRGLARPPAAERYGGQPPVRGAGPAHRGRPGRDDHRLGLGQLGEGVADDHVHPRAEVGVDHPHPGLLAELASHQPGGGVVGLRGPHLHPLDDRAGGRVADVALDEAAVARAHGLVGQPRAVAAVEHAHRHLPAWTRAPFRTTVQSGLATADGLAAGSGAAGSRPTRPPTARMPSSTTSVTAVVR